MTPIKDKKPIKVGHSFYFLIPKQYIDNGAIDLDKSYDLDVNENQE